MSLQCPTLFADRYPDLCRAVDHYCERTTPDLDAELVNAFTNAAFLVGAALAWRLQARQRETGASTLIRILIVAMAAVGLGSFLFHTLGTRWAEWGDVIPILVFMLLYLWFVLTYLIVLPSMWKVPALALFCAATFLLEARVPGDVLWGGALYAPTILTFIAIGTVLKLSEHPAANAMIGAIVVFFAALTARSSDMPVCDIFPLGTHFLWHLLNATLLYLLVRLAILKVPKEAIGQSKGAAV
ncbi:MAG: ceramidase domain-containing protein [Dongiaceae bacterium]